MAMGLPTLSKNGWIDNRSSILEKLYKYWLVSLVEDSNVFSSDIESLKFVMSKSQDIETSVDQISESLTKLLDPYFDDVNIVSRLEEEGNKVHILVNINARYGEEEYNLERVILGNSEKQIDFTGTMAFLMNKELERRQ